jgi:uncharacterized protein YaaN involved in tellurite resistance
MASTETTTPAAGMPTMAPVAATPPATVQPLVAYKEADPEVKARIKAKAELNVEDSNSIIFFGSKAQQQLTESRTACSRPVRTKDIGPAGDALNGMVKKLRELKFEAIDPRDRPGFLARLFGAEASCWNISINTRACAIRSTTSPTDLERHKTTLLTDITKLDKLYDVNLDYFRTLEVYIAAGRAKLQELDERRSRRWRSSVEGVRRDRGAKLRDLRSRRDDLERRVHDLLLTRQVTMQSLPSIRLVQENDKSLITKINSTMANTVPLWRQQLAQAITIYRSGQAATAVKAASDLTNELLEKNADKLRTSTPSASGGRARRLRHRGGQARQRPADRDDRGQPADCR